MLGDLVYGTVGLICELMVSISAEPDGHRGVTLCHQEVHLSFFLSVRGIEWLLNWIPLLIGEGLHL
jgi:hypothetical protein